MTRYSMDFYNEHPKTCARTDFWGQVRRTVNGRPVDEQQIEMIVDAVCSGLELNPRDRLLDLCCGNGALTTRFLARCAGGLGVDRSPALISVAHEFFQRDPRETYHLDDVLDFAGSMTAPAAFDKAVCYGSFQYLPEDRAEALLATLRQRFEQVRRLYVGNLPDRELLGEFYRERDYEAGIEDDPGSAIGIWRTREQFSRLAALTGWEVEFRKMPEGFYASHYRYEAILCPR